MRLHFYSAHDPAHGGGSTFQGARSSMTGGSDFLPHHSLNLSGASFFIFASVSFYLFSDLFLRVVIFFLCLFERTLHFFMFCSL